jgi:hypothetical protein
MSNNGFIFAHSLQGSFRLEAKMLSHGGFSLGNSTLLSSLRAP